MKNPYFTFLNLKMVLKGYKIEMNQFLFKNKKILNKYLQIVTEKYK